VGTNRELRLQARYVQFRESSRGLRSAKDEITEHAEHPVTRQSRRGSWRLRLHTRADAITS
jgi:hypothetical protein